MLKSRFPFTEPLSLLPLDVAAMKVPTFYPETRECSNEMLEYISDLQPDLWNSPPVTSYPDGFVPIHPMLQAVPILAPVPQRSTQSLPPLLESCVTPEIFFSPSDGALLLHDGPAITPRSFTMEHYTEIPQQSLLTPGNALNPHMLESSSCLLEYPRPVATTAVTPVPRQVNHSSTLLSPSCAIQGPTVSTKPSPVILGRQPQDQRSARRQALIENLGFTPVDPDRITTHEKKRLYLECLEEYVRYLQRQIELYGGVPVALAKSEEVTDALTNESLRTLLIHMQMKARASHEEQKKREDQYRCIRK